MIDAPLFANRIQAGERLAQVIDTNLQKQLASGIKPVPIVYALPRGGLPVAAPIADLLGCPLTVTVAKKISHPSNSELAIGAVAASGQVLWMQQKLLRFQPNSQWRKAALEAALNKAKSIEAQFLPFCPQVDAKGATLILVDDGIATGMTIAVAAKALSMLAPAQIWLCAPFAPPSLLSWLQQWCDGGKHNYGEDNVQHRTIVLATPEPFLSVSNFYAEFPQVEIREALMYLREREGQWKG
jgi:putative phosphoribosyl transferase